MKKTLVMIVFLFSVLFSISLFAISESTLQTLQQLKSYTDKEDPFITDTHGRLQFDYLWAEDFHEFLKPRCSVLSRCFSSDLSKAICSKQPRERKAKCTTKRYSFCNQCLVTKDSMEALINCEKQRIDCSYFKNHFTKHFVELRSYVNGFWTIYQREKQSEIESKKIQVAPPPAPPAPPNPALEKSVQESNDTFDIKAQ